MGKISSILGCSNKVSRCLSGSLSPVLNHKQPHEIFINLSGSSPGRHAIRRFGRYLGDAEKIKAAAEAVKNQTKVWLGWLKMISILILFVLSSSPDEKFVFYGFLLVFHRRYSHHHAYILEIINDNNVFYPFLCRGWGTGVRTSEQLVIYDHLWSSCLGGKMTAFPCIRHIMESILY